jgi:predicted SprT family Zn-dependent metalloprotease
MRYNKLLLVEPSITFTSDSQVKFLCDCGKETIKRYKNVINGHTKSCGKCNEISIETKSIYGKLRPVEHIIMKSGSGKKHPWVCDCGKSKLLSTYNIINGKTTSCGECSLVTVSTDLKFGRLQAKKEIIATPSSTKKYQWVCDCGKETTKIFNNVYNGHTKSCGSCNLFSKSDLSNLVFGRLRVLSPVDIHKNSDKTIDFLCTCGHIRPIQAKLVFNGSVTRCGKCSLIPKKDMENKKYGKLSMKYPTDIKPGSSKKVTWICGCGQEAIIPIKRVISGQNSCGNCMSIIKSHFNSVSEQLKFLTYPIDPNHDLVSWFNPEEPITNGHKKIKCRCPVCNSVHFPRFSDILRGIGITCGCVQNRISTSQKEICDWLNSIGIMTVTEHPVNSLKYDIYIKTSNMVIEFQGLKWHSLPDAKRKDLNKFRNAIKNNVSYMMVYEDEWLGKRNLMEDIIKQRLMVNKNAHKLRPSNIDVKRVEAKTVDEFYEENHYIGKCKSPLNYVAYYNGSIISAMSFKRPTRKSIYEWELVRMASDPNYRVHGIWSKLFKEFKKDFNPNSIISFSDTRLFRGDTYEKLGFVLDGEISSDYYWVRGTKRYHKSAMRKKKNEVGTESELRKKEGYSKIWDVGKKRWLWKLKDAPSV